MEDETVAIDSDEAVLVIAESGTLMHYGTPRRSGRYPWGSGDTPYQRASSFIGEAAALRKKGLKETEIAAYFGMTTTQLRARQADAKNYKRQQDISTARKLVGEKQMSVTAAAQRMGLPETTVRNLLKPDADLKATKTEATRDILRAAIDKDKFIDFGKGVETNLGVTTTVLNTAVQQLKDEGYKVYPVYIRQVGVEDGYTPTKVICPPGTKPADLHANRDKIRVPGVVIDADGVIKGSIKPPVSVDSRRLDIRYGDEGGSDRDGIIELRRGVQDLDLGASHYAQVRIAVDKTHYLKGVALYSDDLPDGVDIRFNTNKNRKDASNKLDALKRLEDTGDPTNQFGAVIKRQAYYKDKNGRSKQSPLNIVNEEGDWDNWSNSLASQMLSKQSHVEARRQLKVTQDRARKNLEEIMALTNPVIRKKMLESYAEDCDSKAVSLKAAAYPRQATQLILPVPKLKDNEIYAPNFRHGERVALIRYPHGGTFEIPELVVNNRDKHGIATLGRLARDAVGINPKVAERLSGADFDGDTVVVIPNNDRRVRSTPPLRGLEGFDPKAQYAERPGMSVMKKGAMTQRQMGEITNLINDMTLKGATSSEIARAVKHSMVVIDAAKHRLDYKQSEIDNDIDALKTKYQRNGNPKGKGGAATLISRAKSKEYVEEVRLRKASEGGKIDPKTGELVYVKTGRTRKKDYKDPDSEDILNLTRMERMRLTKDAHTLVSTPGTTMEHIYADHANILKGLANAARKASLEQRDIPYSPEARVKYSEEVESLRTKIKDAYRNKPRERQAQLLANSRISLQRQANPDMDKDDIRKAERLALANARAAVGSHKYNINITPREWEAIQSGAVRRNMLEEIVANASSDHLQELATPRTRPTLTTAQINRAQRMLKNNTTSEVAEALGVSTATIRELVTEGADS